VFTNSDALKTKKKCNKYIEYESSPKLASILETHPWFLNVNDSAYQAIPNP